jgi:hypothetical protein
MTDTQQFNAFEDMDAYHEMLKKIQEQIDPRDYLAPSMREIAYLTLEELEAERNLVVAKQSTRSRAQRDMIESRWEYEQTILNSKEDGVD